MKIAYLINQYPHVSHSFIRREIAALEANGVEVQRFSIRRPTVKLTDPADVSEAAKTTVLLDAGVAGLAASALKTAASRPLRFCRAMQMAWRLGRRSERGVLRHMVYVAEACMLLKLTDAHIHAHFGTNSAAVAMLSRILGGPSYSFTVHGPEEFDHPAALSLKEKIENASFIIAISEFGRSQLYRWCDLPDWPKISVIHCGVDQSFMNADSPAIPQSRRFVCVGRLCEQKGQLLLVQAAAQLANSGMQFELTLVGDGPMRPQIETLIHQHNLQSIVRITGWASGQQVRDEILAARAMVLPSFAEGLPVVLMEALALSRPVISTYVAGIPELVEHNVNGWLVPAGSIEALTNAMRQALETPLDQLAQMGQAGRTRAIANHDVAKEAAKLKELFQQSIRAHDDH